MQVQQGRGKAGDRHKHGAREPTRQPMSVWGGLRRGWPGGQRHLSQKVKVGRACRSQEKERGRISSFISDRCGWRQAWRVERPSGRWNRAGEDCWVQHAPLGEGGRTGQGCSSEGGKRPSSKSRKGQEGWWRAFRERRGHRNTEVCRGRGKGQALRCHAQRGQGAAAVPCLLLGTQ